VELVKVYGEAQNLLDDKGRVNVPRRCAPLFSNGGFLTRAFNEKSLIFYPTPIWDTLQQRLEDIKTRIADQDPASFLKTERATGNLHRFLNCGVQVTELDGQNRLLIPPSLRGWANLKKEVTFIGMGDTLEIWDTETWHAYNGEQLTIDELDRSMSALSIRVSSV